MEIAPQTFGILLQVATGIGLAACAGLRAFLPLLAVGVAGRADWLPVAGPFEWLESWPAILVFASAVVAEVLADKFPVVDHFLDTVQTFVRPVAGAVAMTCVLTELTPLQSAVLGIIGGTTTAGAVHLAKANLRLASTATTAGIGNPALSVLEDIGAAAGSVAAILLPLATVLVIVAVAILLWWVVRRARRLRPLPTQSAA